jgi:mannose-6-phosphate isomerase-like protein (cupin superfamily)
MSIPDQTVVRHAGQGDTVDVFGSPYTVKAAAADTAGAYTLVEQTLTGAPPPMHVHDGEEEAFYILDGKLVVFLGEQRLTAGPGAFVLVPRGLPHTFHPAGGAPPRFLVIGSPAGIDRMFTELAQRFPAADGPPNPIAVAELTARYGTRVVGPPPDTA